MDNNSSRRPYRKLPPPIITTHLSPTTPLSDDTLSITSTTQITPADEDFIVPIDSSSDNNNNNDRNDNISAHYRMDRKVTAGSWNSRRSNSGAAAAAAHSRPTRNRKTTTPISFYSCEDVIEYPIIHYSPYPVGEGYWQSIVTLFNRMAGFVMKVVFTIVPRPQPGIWTLENSMNTWSLQFKDDKIERGYQWNVNKRYLRANRRFSWFFLIFSLSLVVYNWLVEAKNRFLFYIPCHILMILPMIFCTAFTYIKHRERYFVYKYMHIVLTTCLFITSLAWIFGQPFVLISLRDPLILDPLHTLLIFFIYNLAITNLYLASMSTTVLICIQGLTCVIGLQVTGRPFSQTFSYLINDFVSLVLAYIFAFMCARVKELYMRQIYLVRHFQQEEAHILASSRLKLQILDEGMKALKNQHPQISPPSSPVTSRTGSSLFTRQQHGMPFIRHATSEPNLPKYPPRAFISGASSPYFHSQRPSLDGCGSNASSSYNYDPNSPFLRLMRSCQMERNETVNGMVVSVPNTRYSSKFDDLEVAIGPSQRTLASADENNKEMFIHKVQNRLLSYSSLTSVPTFNDIPKDNHDVPNDVFSSTNSESLGDQNTLFRVLLELPHWLWTLPHAFHSRNQSKKKSIWKRLYQFFKFKVCMYSGEEKMEEGFKLYFNPLSICRIKVLALSAIVGGVTITSLNFIIQSYEPFDTIIRLAFIPTVALIAYSLLSFERIMVNPRMTQSIILTSVYFLFIGYLMLVLATHGTLRSVYSLIDPLSRFPTLNTPSARPVDESQWFPWLPDSPFDPNVPMNDIWNSEKSSSLSPAHNDSSSTVISTESLQNNDNHSNDNTNDRKNDTIGVIDIYDANNRPTPEQITAYKRKLMEDFVEAESKYMIQLNALTLFCCFAASSSGMRLVYYLIWASMVTITVSASAIYSTCVNGHDGQRLRTVLVIIAVIWAGIWIVRPLESEIRKWYQIKLNFGL